MEESYFSACESLGAPSASALGEATSRSQTAGAVYDRAGNGDALLRDCGSFANFLSQWKAQFSTDSQKLMVPGVIFSFQAPEATAEVGGDSLFLRGGWRLARQREFEYLQPRRGALVHHTKLSYLKALAAPELKGEGGPGRARG